MIALLTLNERYFVFIYSRLRLTLTMRRLNGHLDVSIAWLVFQRCGIITNVCITVRLRRANVSTDTYRHASTQLFTCPIYRYKIRGLSVVVASVLFRPFIRSHARRVSPFSNISHRENRFSINVLLFQQNRRHSILVRSRTFCGQNRLSVITVCFLRGIVRFRQVVCIMIVSSYRYIMFRTVLFRRFSSLRRFVRKKRSLLITAVFIVGLLQTICQGSRRRIILFRRAAPIIIRRYPIYLSTIICLTSITMLTLRLRYFPVRASQARRHFAAIPNGRGLQRHLAFRVFLSRFFRWLFTRSVVFRL